MARRGLCCLYRRSSIGSLREYPPSPPLAGHVACFWARSPAGPSAGHRVLPDGCIDIVFAGPAGEGLTGTVVGTMTRPLLVPGDAPAFVGVRFLPGKAAGILRTAAHQLTDARVALAELDLSGWRQAAGALALAPTPLAQIGALDRYLRGLLAVRPPRSDPYVDAVVRLIQQRRGDVKVSRLGAHTGISRQHLARRFREEVGVSPKTFARIARFTALVGGLSGAAGAGGGGDPSRVGWGGLAADLGYCDQSHLIAEFIEFAGESPARWLTGRRAAAGSISPIQRRTQGVACGHKETP